MEELKKLSVALVVRQRTHARSKHAKCSAGFLLGSLDTGCGRKIPVQPPTVNAMEPAYAMAVIPQKRSTENGKIPGCSFILSVGGLLTGD